jgi:hypothetical protein
MQQQVKQAALQVGCLLFKLDLGQGSCAVAALELGELALKRRQQ